MFKVVTLPVGKEKAVTGYEVSIFTYGLGRETMKFSGFLSRNNVVTGSKIIVGSIIQDGQGGETVINFTDDEEETLYNMYVALWTFGFEVNEDLVMNHNAETVVDTLAYEALGVIAKKLAKRKK